MTERYSIADARYNFPKLVREAELGKIVELTRRGELVAILIGHRHFEQLSSNNRGFAETYRNFAENVNLVNLNIEPDRLFPAFRKPVRKQTVDQ